MTEHWAQGLEGQGVKEERRNQVRGDELAHLHVLEFVTAVVMGGVAVQVRKKLKGPWVC